MMTIQSMTHLIIQAMIYWLRLDSGRSVSLTATSQASTRRWSLEPKKHRWVWNKLSWRSRMSQTSATASTSWSLWNGQPMGKTSRTTRRSEWRAQISCSKMRQLSTSTTSRISSKLYLSALSCSSRSSTTTCYRFARWRYHMNFAPRLARAWWSSRTFCCTKCRKGAEDWSSCS